MDVNTGLENLRKLFSENPPFNSKIEILNEDICSGVDLEESHNNMTENMIKSFDTFCKNRLRTESVGLRLARSLPCLNYLTANFKNVPIFVTGAGNTNTDNPRDANECIDINRIISFTTCIACYVSDFNSYKQ